MRKRGLSRLIMAGGISIVSSGAKSTTKRAVPESTPISVALPVPFPMNRFLK